MNTPSSLSILILGGTGFIGAQQVGYALSRGHRVTVFNRGTRANMWPAEVEVLRGDRESGAYAALNGRAFDVCIDNKSSVPHWVQDAAAALGRRVQHYLLISTLSVYSDHAAPAQDETAARETFNGANPCAITAQQLRSDMSLYGAMKARCEDEVLKHYPNCATILRAGLIVGPGDESDRFTYWPVRIARGGEVLSPPAHDPVRFIDVRDLAQWTIRLAEARTFGTFNTFGPSDPLTMGEMLAQIALAIKANVRFAEAPREFLAQHQVNAWSDLPVWMGGVGETAGFHLRSNARALAAGLTFTQFEKTVVDTLAWWRAQPNARTTRLLAGLSEKRETEVLAALHSNA
jgi:2'-hydroxyisoflavone reductase